jgi:hypothetical protein
VLIELASLCAYLPPEVLLLEAGGETQHNKFPEIIDYTPLNIGGLGEFDAG